jgi:general L-amino acid transport system permease protein
MTNLKPPKTVDIKGIIIQGLFVAVALLIITVAYSSARTNLNEMGMSSGFGFLDRTTGWSYSFSLVDKSPDDTYRWTLFSGFLNSAFLGFVSIVLATILGLLIGTARDSMNTSVKMSASIFIQIFRNIPLILQLLFWYAVMIHLPSTRQAVEFFDLVFVSNRGVMLPGIKISFAAVVAISVAAFMLWIVLSKCTKLNSSARSVVWFSLMVLLSVSFVAYSVPAGEGFLSVPELKGLKFVGGITLPVELTAMLVAIVLYGAAYIAEVVRGGLQEVPQGLVEAGRSLGLSERKIWTRIKMPMALRTILPAVGNQWIFLMKATTIGVAIGFSDLFMIVSTSITQSGQTLELIGILMAAFLLVNLTIAQLVNYMNSKLALKGH